jgi:raffinose/stachyose/melibiose transport system substrate-binding protein
MKSDKLSSASRHTAPRARSRAFALVAIAAVGIGGLTACSSSAESAVSDDILDGIPVIDDCPEPADVTIWALQNSEAQADLDSAMAKAFEEQCEGSKITYQYYTGEALNEKVTTIMVAGTPPTVIQPTDPNAMKPYFDSGQLLTADDVLNKADPDWHSKFLASALKRTQLDGDDTVYGFPAWGASPLLLWYNKDVFKDVGIDEPPQTLDELNEDIEIIKDAGIIPIALGNADKSPSTFWAQYLTEREGGTAPMEAVRAGEPGAWSDPAFIEGLTQLQQMAENGAFGVGFDSTGNQNGADRALFYTGKAAMMLSNANFISKVASAAPEFVESGAVGQAEVPKGKQDENTLVGNPSVNYFITAKSTEAQQQVIASYFTNILASDAYAEGLASVGVTPATTGADGLMPDTPIGQAVGWSYDLASKSDLQSVWTNSLGSYNTVVQDNTAAIASGSMTPQQFADEMNKTLE